MVSWTRDILGEDWAGGVIGDAVGDGSTLGVGDGSTLGCGTTLVCGTTLGGVTTLGGDNAVGVVDGGARAVLVFQWEKRSRSLEIADSCSWWIFVEAYLTAQDKKFGRGRFCPRKGPLVG